MRAAFVLTVLAACSFNHGQLRSDASDSNTATDSQADAAEIDADLPACAWGYVPTNFVPCDLPAPAPLLVNVTGTLNTTSTPLPKLAITQADGTTITVIHLSRLDVELGMTLTVQGTGVVFAVDGPVNIAGTIVVAAGFDTPQHCTTSFGRTGADSTNTNGGGGGGGGGAAGEDGGDGGDGAGNQAGLKGLKGLKVTSTLSPLRGGCRGGHGGRHDQLGTAPPGGRGGGALEISTNARVTVTGTGFLDAAGRGGLGGTAQVGGSGGGSGGAIFLEGPMITLELGARVCADGGSGGEGGGSTVSSNSGVAGACTGMGGATTAISVNNGGDPGSGGWSGGGAVSGGGAASDAGGGAGGGGVGWIRVRSPNFTASQAIVTPAATLN